MKRQSVVYWGLMAVLLLHTASAEPVAKKIIATGWDTLRVQPEEILANAEKFADSGVDGINITFSTRSSTGKQIKCCEIFSGVEFTYDDVKKYVPIFQKIAVTPGLKESLLTVWWTPKGAQRLKWDDNEGWRIIANNMGVMARLAKDGGLKGLFLDWEDYGKVGQFECKEEDPPLDKTIKLARQRGQEIGNAIFKEYPNVTFFSYWWLCSSSHIASLQAEERAYALKKSVWVSFVDGLFDVMPDGVKMIDGREHYHLESYRRDFYTQGTIIQSGCQALLSPENRAKYRRAISVSYGHFLDMYTNDKSAGHWYYGPEGGSRLEHFRRNLEQSFLAASEYVWIYGEQGLFVPFTGCSDGWIKRQQPWESKLPGYLDVLKKTKSSCSFADEKTVGKETKTPSLEKKKAYSSSRQTRKKKCTEKQGELPKKFIATGSAFRDVKPKDLIKYSSELARIGFDGVTASFNTSDSWGNKIGSDGMFAPVKYTVTRLRPFLTDMTAFLDKDGLKESLVYINLSPTEKERLPWHSEKRWALFVHNMGMMAKLTKASKLKGFYLDVSDVNKTSQFMVTEKEKGSTYEFLEKTARRRGKALGRAIFAAYPDITLFASSWFSAESDLIKPSDLSFAETLKKRKSLWPAFVNGIIDEMPKSARLVDGCGKDVREAKKSDYYKAMSDLYAASRLLVDSANTTKFLTSLSPASGDSLDRYKTSSPNHSFWRNLSQAAATSTEYVWVDVGSDTIFGEGASGVDARIPLWRDVVYQVKDERAWIDRYLKENEKTLVDMVPDPTTACGISRGYFAYIDSSKRDVAKIESDKTVGEGDNVSFKMTNCGMAGTLMCRVQNIKPNEVYIVQFSTKGYPVSAKVSWRENSAFRWNVPSVGLAVTEEGASGWRKVSKVIRTPDISGYNELYLMIDMRGCKEDDSSWVDNIHIYKIK